jgi:hypothetical protein
MSPDLDSLSTADLDDLIARAVHARTQRTEPHPDKPPQEFEATLNPAWFVFLMGSNSIVQFRHAGAGWVSVAIPPPERAHLATMLTHHALLAPPPPQPAQAPPSLASGGGGNVH